MLIYLSVYAVSLISSFYAWKEKSLLLQWFLHVLAILPLVLLGGLRDRSIGSDTDFYIWDRFSDAVKYRDSIVVFLLTSNQEIGYMLSNWLIAQLTDSHAVYLSVMEFLVVTPMYIVAWKFRKTVPSFLIMFFFIFIQYQYSFSIIRQSVALSFCLLSFCYFEEKKFFKSLLLEIIAVSFHYSAFLALLFPLSNYLVKKWSIYRYREFYILFFLIFIFCVANIDLFLKHMISVDLINQKYMVYASDSDVFAGRIQWSNMVIKIVIAYIGFVVFITRKPITYSFLKKIRRYKYIDFFFVMAILDIAFSLLGSVNSEWIRLSYYPRLISFISVPFYMKYYNYRCFGKFGIKPIMCTLIVFFWWYIYIWGGYGDVDDYKLNKEIYQLLFL